MSIIIIDYNMGNPVSIKNMIKRIGYDAIITANANEIMSAKKCILPGVGAFDAAMNNLIQLDLTKILKLKILEEKIPVLGICLGMHLMTNRSEEGKEPGFGFIDAEVKKFSFESKSLKIPHMGWNLINIKKNNKLLTDLPIEPRFYFVHSFYVHCNNEEHIITTTNYGNNFVSSFEKENIMGVQFHPEKSHKFGMQLLKNFIEKY
jgi:glutamine amidotransferase